jgi:hypothetical protein
MENEQEQIEQKETEQSSQEHFGQAMDEILSDKGETDTEVKESADSNIQSSEDDSTQSAEADESSQSDEQQTQTDTTDIDPEVMEIFNDYGLSQATIESIVKESPDLLTSIKEEIENEKQESKPVKKEVSQSAPKSNFKEIKVKLDPDIVGADVKSAIDSIVARINEQGKSLESETQRLQQERENSFQSKIDGVFDRFSKQLPDIGNSSNMTEKQYKTRIELFRHAGITSEVRGISIEKAIEIEVNKYKNQDGERVASQRLLDKLKGQKKHFTNTPTRRHSDFSSRKFESEEDRKIAVMTDAYKEANIED